MTTQAAQPRRFPDGFLWGAATAAYQVEGAVTADGRGRSIWDTFSHTPGRILGGDTGDIAVDHYHRVEQDVAMMAELGITGYRFSIAWPRVQPYGKGPANQPGLDFYRRLIDTLRNAGIEPFATLYHWDLPQPLEDAGGWPERDTAHRFADYASLVHNALGDRIARWATINEPWCAAYLGYGSGDHAPGRRDHTGSVAAAHHLLLAHGLALSALRQNGSAVGPALNLYPVAARTDAVEDLDAARRIDGLQNRFFLDAVLRGEYPEDVRSDLEPYGLAQAVRDGDLDIIGAPIDHLGINYYNRFHVTGRADAEGHAVTSPFATSSPWPGASHVAFVPAGAPVTSMGWEIDPSGLYDVLTRVAREYPAVPLYVTENGAAFDDTVTADGVHDPDRIAYLDGHLRACHDALQSGVPLSGYFAWSLMDNFEWGWGYAKRFGLVHVDYATQTRIPKSSAYWFGAAARRNALPPDPAE